MDLSQDPATAPSRTRSNGDVRSRKWRNEVRKRSRCRLSGSPAPTFRERNAGLGRPPFSPLPGKRSNWEHQYCSAAPAFQNRTAATPMPSMDDRRSLSTFRRVAVGFINRIKEDRQDCCRETTVPPSRRAGCAGRPPNRPAQPALWINPARFRRVGIAHRSPDIAAKDGGRCPPYHVSEVSRRS